MKRCPCCGSADIRIFNSTSGWNVTCVNCCFGTPFEKTKAEAVNDWETGKIVGNY